MGDLRARFWQSWCACPAVFSEKGTGQWEHQGSSAKPPWHKEELRLRREARAAGRRASATRPSGPVLTPAVAQLSAGSCFQIPHIAGQFLPGKVTRFYFQAGRAAQAAGAPRPGVLSPIPVTHLVSRLYQAQSSFSTEMSRLDDIGFTARHRVFLEKQKNKGCLRYFPVPVTSQNAVLSV